MDSLSIRISDNISLNYSHTRNGMDYFGVLVGESYRPRLLDVVEGCTDTQVVDEFLIRESVSLVAA